MMNNKETFTIKFVARKTGLSAHVIRAWEKRYGAVEPLRTETNRRLYTIRDIERLELLKAATAMGHSIGRIAQYPTEDLRELINLGDSRGQQDTEAPNSFANYIGDAEGAILQFDAHRLENLLMQASVNFSQPILIDEVIVPLIVKIGERWEDGSFRVSHEHFASDIIKHFLNNLRSNLNIPDTAPRLLVTTPSGQHHELGALVVALTAAVKGWHVTYLGPNLPAEEIASAARSNQARVLCLSIVYPSDDARMKQELSRLGQIMPSDVRMMVGGRAAESYKQTLDDIGGAILIPDLVVFRKSLDFHQHRP